MKDECKGKILLKFVGLRSKMYAIVYDNSELYAIDCETMDIKRLKGIKNYVVQKRLSVEDFEKCLFEH